MDFRILDASAFYAGVPFRSSEDYYTTSLVYDEIQHIKKNQGVLGTLLETNRLKIREPEGTINSGCKLKLQKRQVIFHSLSKQDISIIALGDRNKRANHYR